MENRNDGASWSDGYQTTLWKLSRADGKLAPVAQLLAVLEEQEWEGHHGDGQERQQRRRPLVTQLMVHLHTKEREGGGERASDKGVGGQDTGGVELVGVDEEGKDAAESEESSEKKKRRLAAWTYEKNNSRKEVKKKFRREGMRLDEIGAEKMRRDDGCEEREHGFVVCSPPRFVTIVWQRKKNKYVRDEGGKEKKERRTV